MTGRWRYFLIDLDDTLAPEWDFVDGGYRAAADVLAGLTGRDAAELHRTFVYEHLKNGRRGIMDRMAQISGAGEAAAPALIDAYRGHDVAMRFYSGAREALESLAAAGARMAVVTDGATVTQTRKAVSLGLPEIADAIVYCDEARAPKPDPKGFSIAMERLGAAPEETLLVGDDPLHDIAAAVRLGLPAVRVRTGRFGQIDHAPGAATGDLKAFADLPAWLAWE